MIIASVNLYETYYNSDIAEHSAFRKENEK